MNVSGTISGIKKKADWVALIVSAYSQADGDIQSIIDWYLSPRGALHAATYNLSHLGGFIQWNLLKAPTMQAGIFKGSLIARLLIELGLIIPSKYKALTEKLMKGSAIAALTLHASPGLGGKGGGSGGGSRGENPFNRSGY